MKKKLVLTGLVTTIMLMTFISSTYCASTYSFQGTIRYIGLEGGFWGIIATDGKQYEPINLADEYKKDGLTVQIEALDRNRPNIHMWGTLIEIVRLTSIVEDVDFFINRGIEYGRKGNYNLAIEDFSKAITIDPQYAKAYYYRGLCSGYSGDYDSAIADYNKVLSINPQDMDVYFVLGRAYLKTDRYSKALEAINQGLSYGNYQCEFYTVRASVYYKIGNIEQAISDLQTAISFFDKIVLDHYNPYFNLANIYYDLGDYTKAIDYYNDAVKVQSDCGDVYYARGLSHQASGNYDLAQRDFTKAKELGYEVK